MKQINYNIYLEQPVIISQQAATVGIHQSLDYITGSALLGMVAARLYHQLSKEEAFLVFHSGKVRFLDALPLCDDEVAYPVPFCYHSFKAEKYTDGQQIIAEKIFDISKTNADELQNKQPVQLRNFYLTLSGQKCSPNREQCLKTAIDPKSNRAAESQLFGYEALSAGQQFAFTIQVDDDVPDDIVQKLQELSGFAQLGRSRSAQFGAVKISEQPDTNHISGLIDDDNLTLWLLSDLQLIENGQPTLIPSAAALGLPVGSKWIADSSFVRSRRYSVYNAYRRHYDKERQVICRGSVLRYQLPQDLSADEKKALQSKIERGLGLNTESGLGQVAINPNVLATKNPKWHTQQKTTQEQSKTVKNPQSALISTLIARKNVAEVGSKPVDIAQDIFANLCQKVTTARSYHAMAKGIAFDSGKIPSRTQFGRFKEQANNYRNNPERLWQVLSNQKNGMLVVTSENESDNRQSGSSYQRAGWQLRYGTNNDENLGTFLLSELKEHLDKSYFSQIVAELAVFGLSETWEKYCLGMADNQQKQGDNA